MGSGAHIPELARGLFELCRLMRRYARGEPYALTVPKVFTAPAATVSASAGATTSFTSESLQNEKYPFVLQQVDITDTASESNWRLLLRDASTGYNIINGVVTRALRGLDMRTGGTEKAGAPTPLAHPAWDCVGYPIGPTGGFTAKMTSIGTGTTSVLALKGLWILEA